MKPSHIRIASYNLQKCVGLDLRRRPDRTLSVINALGADLVVLQEADKRLPPRPAALPHDMIETSHLELPGLEPRGAVRADLSTAIGPLRVVGLHLGLVRRHRHLQLAAIMRALRELPPCPTLLAGDFNEWGSVAGLDATAHGLDFLRGAPSFPALRPVARLDRFALGPGLQALKTGSYSARPARMASDHLPIWVDLSPALAPRPGAC